MRGYPSELIQRLMESKDAQNARIRELEAERDRLQKLVEAHESRYRARKKGDGQLLDERDRLRKERDNLNRLNGEHIQAVVEAEQKVHRLEEEVGRLQGLLDAAKPILATVAEELCVYEDGVIDGLSLSCEPPWAEGPNGKAPDGGPACEPCRSRAWLEKARARAGRGEDGTE